MNMPLATAKISSWVMLLKVTFFFFNAAYKFQNSEAQL